MEIYINVFSDNPSVTIHKTESDAINGILTDGEYGLVLKQDYTHTVVYDTETGESVTEDYYDQADDLCDELNNESEESEKTYGSYEDQVKSDYYGSR